MADLRTHRDDNAWKARAHRQARELADSIDAAAADLAENGPVSRGDLAGRLAELEAEWAAEERALDREQPRAFER